MVKLMDIPLPEKPINLSLQQGELRQLVELAYLGEWLVNAHHGADHIDESADQRIQQLFAASHLTDVGRDPETGEYFLEAEWASRLYDQYILDYDDHVFWDELTERLAQRDLAKERGVSIDDIDREEDLAALRPLEQRYRDEFERDGIDNLKLTDRF